MHESNEMSFGWCFIIYLVFWKTWLSSLDIFWSWMWSGTWTFFCGYSIGIRIWQWCKWMRCHVERGYGNLTPYGNALWIRVKRHAIHHGCIVCAQRTRGRLLQEFMTRWYCKRSWKIGREPLYLLRKESCMWPTCITIFYWSLDLSFLTSGWCH